MATLKEDPPLHPIDIVLIPPNELGCVSDEECANKHDCAKNVNNIGKEIWNQKEELVVYRNQHDANGNGFDDEVNIRNSEVNISNTEMSQLYPSKSNPIHTNLKGVQRILETQENMSTFITSDDQSEEITYDRTAKRKY